MSRTHRSRLLAVPTAMAALAAALAPSAQATTSPPALATSVANAVTYVKGLQDANGHFVTTGLSNEWAFSGLAAAGTAAADVLPAAPNNTSAYNARLVYRGDLSAAGWPGASPVATDYERATLNAYSAGIDPARVSPGRNLIADIAAAWQTASPGYWGSPSLFNGTVFGLLALSAAKTPSGAQRVPQALLNTSIQTVRNNQHTDGGWNYPKAEGVPAQLAAVSDIDMTGAAMASLCQAGVPSTDSAIVAAKSFLKGKLVATTGAFNSSFGANTDSNGWAVSGLNACGIPSQGTDFTTSSGATPIDFLVGQQVSGGGFRYTTGTTPNAYASLDALRALAGGAFSATPPTPSTPGEPRFVGSTAFASGTTSKLALVVDDGSGTLKVCAVPVSPTTSTTTLGTVLTAATTSATPSGCVSGFSPASGTITTVNGVANAGTSSWKVSVDGATAAAAATTTTIGVGDTIALTYGS
ncbi:MAG TPA: prenyltransferase/squalene oxidase repeat-containing protein [Baekduia sp.]|uniref:prenyltransferase/squalene oxidase repeat-containing protein n=1 Tax=Baekduia sp. TaxID=2600305 RepID=UPI002D765783|nr:prenyltransferase/squalene oxidase repeat-containing protein [Baekduia sp.]HET6508072.1 prenyltransferase/squalene oxidase repeat-containing protein [Baekduia sp.]